MHLEKEENRLKLFEITDVLYGKDHDSPNAEMHFSGFQLELRRLTGITRMDQALYVEMWQRVKRHHRLFASFQGQQPSFGAVLYFVSSPEKGDTIRAYLNINNAKNTHLKLDRAACESNARRYLRLCDRLLYQFYNDDKYAEPLTIVRASFEAGSSTGDNIGTKELKELMRVFVRTQGFFGDESDVERAKAQAKARRRAIWQSNRSAR